MARDSSIAMKCTSSMGVESSPRNGTGSFTANRPFEWNTGPYLRKVNLLMLVWGTLRGVKTKRAAGCGKRIQENAKIGSAQCVEVALLSARRNGLVKAVLRVVSAAFRLIGQRIMSLLDSQEHLKRNN